MKRPPSLTPGVHDEIAVGPQRMRAARGFLGTLLIALLAMISLGVTARAQECPPGWEWIDCECVPNCPDPLWAPPGLCWEWDSSICEWSDLYHDCGGSPWDWGLCDCGSGCPPPPQGCDPGWTWDESQCTCVEDCVETPQPGDCYYWDGSQCAWFPIEPPAGGCPAGYKWENCDCVRDCSVPDPNDPNPDPACYSYSPEYCGYVQNPPTWDYYWDTEPEFTLDLADDTEEELDQWFTEGGTSVSVSVSVTPTDGVAVKYDTSGCYSPESETVSLSPTTTWSNGGVMTDPNSGSGESATFTASETGLITTTFVTMASVDSPIALQKTANKTTKRNQVKLVTRTVFSTPQNQARRVVGVCEQVTIRVTPAPIKSVVSWQATNNDWIDTLEGTSTTFTAADTALDATITATLSEGDDRSVDFMVYEPVPVIEFSESTPEPPLGVGAKGKVYLKPATVNFGNIVVREELCGGSGWGYFASNHQPHLPGPPWSGNVVVPNKGTLMTTVDNIAWSGAQPPFSEGGFTWAIPWSYQSQSGFGDWYSMGVVSHIVGLSRNPTTNKWTLTVEKSQISISDTIP